MADFYLKIIASDKMFFGGAVSGIIVPASDGEYEILAHHSPTIMAIVPGELRYQLKDGTRLRAVVGNGIVQCANNRVTILVESAERPEDIDEKRAQEELERAQEEMRQKQSIQEYRVSQASLARALSRLKGKRTAR